MHADHGLALEHDDVLTGWEHEDQWTREWLEDAACLSHPDPDLWFATRSDPVAAREAKEVCMTCPVRAKCLNYALTHDEPHGIWGGVDEDRRERLRRSLRIPRPHGTHARYLSHVKEGEEPCGPCKRAHADHNHEWELGVHRLDDTEAV